ncbi:MAG: hypothetical protein V3S83_12435 [Gemmatimonadota bacterium]
MAIPSGKSPEVTAALEKLYGRTTAIESDTCTWCKGPATEFKNDLSKHEYTISGMCQECQDKAFEPCPEDEL